MEVYGKTITGLGPILKVHLIETKVVRMLLSKYFFKKYIQQMTCYTILTFSAIGNRNNVISPSEMYHDIFSKGKEL